MHLKVIYQSKNKHLNAGQLMWLQVQILHDPEVCSNSVVFPANWLATVTTNQTYNDLLKNRTTKPYKT